jgi:hypothetical protein
MLGNPSLKDAYGDDIERARRLTVAGMADWCDVASPHTCAECAEFRTEKKAKGWCALAARRSGGHRQPTFAATQRACRQFALAG